MSQDLIVVNLNTICRFCLEGKGAMSSIFDEAEEPSLVEQISSFSDILVEPHEYLPPNVCHRCRTKIEQCFEFKRLLLHSQSLITESIPVKASNEQFSAHHKVELVNPLDNYIVLPINTQNEKPLSSDIQDIEIRNKGLDEEGSTAEATEKKYTIVIGNKNKNYDKVTSGDSVSKSDNIETNNGKKYESEINQYPSIFAAYKKNQCLLCLEKLDSKESLHSHIDSHVEGTELDPYYTLQDRNVYCKVCQKTFEHRFKLINDQRQHLGLKPFVCRHDNCKAAFYSNHALRLHQPNHADKRFICATCGVTFKRKSDCKSHEIIHIDANLQFHCGLCGMICKNRLTYAAHVKKHQIPPRFKCDSCPKEYFSRSELARHVNIHSSEKKYKCENCNSAYYSNSALNRHKKYHLQNDSADETMSGNSGRIMKCRCNKKFFTRTSYARHIENECKETQPNVIKRKTANAYCILYEQAGETV